MTEEILSETVEADSCPPVVSLLNHVMAGIRSIETQYATTVMMAVRKLAEELSAQMTENSGAVSTSDIQLRMATARKAFEERISTTYSECNAERQSLQDEMENLDFRSGVFREIAKTELAIENSEEHIQWMLRDTSVDLGKIMRARIYQTELKAYLRGLRFQAESELT